MRLSAKYAYQETLDIPPQTIADEQEESDTERSQETEIDTEELSFRAEITITSESPGLLPIRTQVTLVKKYRVERTMDAP